MFSASSLGRSCIFLGPLPSYCFRALLKHILYKHISDVSVRTYKYMYLDIYTHNREIHIYTYIHVHMCIHVHVYLFISLLYAYTYIT